jgi:hypothetical protein
MPVRFVLALHLARTPAQLPTSRPRFLTHMTPSFPATLCAPPLAPPLVLTYPHPYDQEAVTLHSFSLQQELVSLEPTTSRVFGHRIARERRSPGRNGDAGELRLRRGGVTGPQAAAALDAGPPPALRRRRHQAGRTGQ